MIITRNIIELGNSKAITLPKEISENLKVGSTIVFDIKIIKNLSSDENINTYKCLACEYTFSRNPYTEDISCPVCNNDNKDAFELIEKECELENGN